MPLPICALNPRRGFHLRLADHGACLHCGVHFVASAIEEARVDENDAVFDSVNACGEVGAGAAFFVHHPDFDRVA